MTKEDRVRPTHASDRDSMSEAWQMLLGIGQASSLTVENTSSKQQSVSFTLITGFLGSGKTTLVNKLLSEPHGMRIAVIVNDFGSVNIDAALIKQSNVDSIDLTNGCVCCTLANGLIRTVSDLLTRDLPPEQIILEASGIAEPYGVIQVALCNRALGLNGIVCLVDADRVAADLENPSLHQVIQRQTAAADLIIINKVDLADTGKVQDVRRWLQKDRGRTRIVETSFANVPAFILLGSSQRAAYFAEEISSLHSNAFETFTFATESLVDGRLLCALMENLPAGVLRVKGIVRLASSPENATVLQATGARWSLEGQDSMATRSLSEIVVIGLRGELDVERLQMRFHDCELRQGASSS